MFCPICKSSFSSSFSNSMYDAHSSFAHWNLLCSKDKIYCHYDTYDGEHHYLFNEKIFFDQEKLIKYFNLKSFQ